MADDDHVVDVPVDENPMVIIIKRTFFFQKKNLNFSPVKKKKKNRWNFIATQPQNSSSTPEGAAAGAGGKFQVNTTLMKSPKAILRFVQWFLALLTFALAGSKNG